MKKFLLSLIVLSMFPIVKTSIFFNSTQSVSSVCIKNRKYVQNSSDDTPYFQPDKKAMLRFLTMMEKKSPSMWLMN